MAWPPAAAKLVVSLAVPLKGLTWAVPRTTLPSMNVTVPLVKPIPGARTEMVAVKVTDWPVAAVLTDDVRATAVEARLTVRAAAAEVLFVKLPVPGEEAVREAFPPPGDVAKVAWPLASTSAVPSTLSPARKVTKPPVGVPAAELTLAVSVTDWPKTAVAVDVRSVVVVATP